MRGVLLGLMVLAQAPALASDFDALTELAIETLDRAQKQSIAEGVEFCGFLLEKDGRQFASPKKRGDESGCTPSYPRYEFTILASYHTHGSHNPDYNSEVPSVDDFVADREDETYGFVGTPGGRVWLIDPFQDEIFEICKDCILQDENYDAREYGEIPENFTSESLEDYLDVER